MVPFSSILVKNLSNEPDVPDMIFDTISGHFQIRVCAESMAGFGPCAEVDATLAGTHKFIAGKYQLVEANHFTTRSVTFWE